MTITSLIRWNLDLDALVLDFTFPAFDPFRARPFDWSVDA